MSCTHCRFLWFLLTELAVENTHGRFHAVFMPFFFFFFSFVMKNPRLWSDAQGGESFFYFVFAERLRTHIHIYTLS